MILITGATGFFGSHLIPKLVKDGYKIRCLVRQSSRVDLLENLNVEMSYGDVTDKKSIEAALNGVDTVIHLAAVLDSTDKRIYDVNVEGAKNLIDVAKNKNIKKIIVLSSAVTMRTDSQLAYPRTKLVADELFLKSGLNCIIIRPTWVYGKGSKSFDKMLSYATKFPAIPIVGDGKCKMQPVYVDDVMHLIKLLLDSGKAKSKVYWIGGSDILSFNEVIDVVAETLKVKKPKVHIPISMVKILVNIMKKISINPLVTDDFIADITHDTTVDITPLKDEFGFVPVGFKEGIEKYKVIE